MFLQKTIISLALSSVVIPSAVQTINITQTTSTYSNTKLVLQGNKNPFDPFFYKAYVHGKVIITKAGADAYQYYQGQNELAFLSPWWGQQWGYRLDLSQGDNSGDIGSMGYILKAYKWAQSHKVNPQGAMISYLNGYSAYKTPYSGTWIFSKDYYHDANALRTSIISIAFTNFMSSAYGFVNEAYSHHQPLSFFFLTGKSNEKGNFYYARVLIGNQKTGATLSSIWYEEKVV